MAIDLFRVSQGIELEAADFSEAVDILFGTGAPGGDTGVQDDSPIGTIYLRTDLGANELQLYYKYSIANSTAADWQVTASKSYVDAVAAGLSWREPAKVRDDSAYADVTAAETVANGTNNVDGIAIAVDDRILLTGLANAETIAAQDETNFDGAGANGTFAIGIGHVIGDVITLTDGSTITVDNTNVNTIAAQDETNFDGVGLNGTFAAGTGHAISDIITMSDGSTITVDNVAGGLVTEFTVTTNTVTPFASGGTITQTSTTGAGINFAITTGLNNEEDGEVSEFTVTTASTSTFLTGATLTQTSTTGTGTGYSITTGTNNEIAGIVSDFTVTTASTAPFASGATQTQTSTTGTGINFAFTTGTNNETASVPDPNNVYIVSGGAGAWTFTEDTNLATDGDALLIQEGTSSDEQYVYDGTNWVLFSSGTSSAELGFIRAFIGKTAVGAETPTYTSADVVTQSGNLEAAIGELDGAFGDGEITNDGGNYSLTDDMAWAAAGTLDTTGALNNLNDAIGDRTYTSDNFVTDGQTVAASIDALDQALITLTNIATANVTTQTAVDTIPVATAEWIKWFVAIEDVGTTTRRRSMEIDVITDGTTIDWTEFAQLKFGGNISGLDVTVDLNAGNIRLLVTSTSGVDVTVRRMASGTFN